MNWLLPQLPRKELPPFPVWWMWLLSPIVLIAVAALVLFFTWPLQRGFAEPRFWLYLLLLPLVVSGALNAFLLSYALQNRREMLFRHLFLDRKRAIWERWGRRSLILTGWGHISPEDNLGSRLVGLDGTVPQAPAKPAAMLPASPVPLGVSPLLDIFSHTLTPLLNVLRVLPTPDVFLSINVRQHEASNALSVCWRHSLNKSLPESNIHLLPEPPDARLLDEWCDTPLTAPRLVMVTQLLTEGSPASEFSVALLFQPQAGMRTDPASFIPVHLFRPVVTPASALVKTFPAWLSVGQSDKARLRHLWDCGLNARERGSLLSLMDEQAVTLPATGRHDLTLVLGPQTPAGFWQGIALAAHAANFGQRGQVVATSADETITLVQLSTDPAPAIVQPPDTLSRYPVAYLGGIFATLLALVLLPVERETVMSVLPWLAGGFAITGLLLCFTIPLSIMLWQKQLDVEWHVQVHASGDKPTRRQYGR